MELLNSAVIAQCIILKGWGTLPLGTSPLMCFSSGAINVWHFLSVQRCFFFILISNKTWKT